MRTSISTTRNLQLSRIDAARRRPDVVVIGVDPGTLVTGYGIVSHSNGTSRLLECGTIRLAANLPLAQRLRRIYAGLRSLIDTHHPDEMAIESAFYGKNAQSALKLGHARGVSLLAAVECNLPTAEYSPREVMNAVAGRGAASKEQVRFMVRSLLHLGDRRMAFDSSDAVAIALCHLQRMALPTGRRTTWSSYIAAHPEKVRR